MEQSKKQALFEVIDEYWNDYNQKKSLPGVVPNSIPIIWFGDIEAYFNSKIKTVTVSLNPSWNEFSSDKNTLVHSFQRFEGAGELCSKACLNDKDKNELVNILNNYFKADPYTPWFNCFDKKCMEIISKYGYDVGYNSRENTAIHIDYYSALATDPAYSKLEEKYPGTYKALQNTALFDDLFSVLDPDVVLFSSKLSTFKECLFKDQTISPDIVKGERSKNKYESKLRSYFVDNRLIIHGRYFRQPFAPISDELKEEFFGEVFEKYQFNNEESSWEITK